MIGIKLFLNDWLHIVKHKQARIAVSVLLLIPLLYAGMFLLGYWDPYGHLDKLPVAVVNLDKGASMQGKPLHIGSDLADNLRNNKTLDFRFVGAADAEAGLANGEYGMLILIPEDFSQKVTTLEGTNPQPAGLVYKTNPGGNFIAGQIGASAVAKLRDDMGNEITKTYTETLLESLGQMSDGFRKAGDGAAQINAGTKKANDGFHTVQEGIDRIADGAARLSAGTEPLAEGQKRLSESMLRLKDGTASLSGGMEKLLAAFQPMKDGAANLAQGIGGLQTGFEHGEQAAERIQTDSQSVKAQLEKWMQSHPDLEKDPELRQIADKADSLSKEASEVRDSQAKLADGAKTVQTGAARLADGLGQYQSKLSQTNAGSRNLASGAAQIVGGMEQWQTGYRSLSEGIHTLADGSRQLRTGTVPLANGMLQLVDGSGVLSKSLTETAQETEGIHSSDSMVSMFSRPVQLVENKIHPVPNYGTAMTPYFLTLGLFVGGLIAANIIPFARRAKDGVTGWAHLINKGCLFLSIAVIQSFIVDAVILLGFKVHVFSVPKFLLLSLAASFTYAACIFMLVTLFGSLGRLVAIFLLVTQLASSGGTFPLQMASPFIRFIGECLPMTYAVQGFRSVISTGDWHQYWGNTEALLGYLAAFLIVAAVIIMTANSKSRPMQQPA